MKFKITDVKAHVPIVTLSTKGNVNLTKQLSSGFKGYSLEQLSNYSYKNNKSKN